MHCVAAAVVAGDPDVVPAAASRHPPRLGALPTEQAPLSQVQLRLSITCLCNSPDISEVLAIWTLACIGDAALSAIHALLRRCASADRELVQIVKDSDSGILLTTYEHLRRQHEAILAVRCQPCRYPLPPPGLPGMFGRRCCDVAGEPSCGDMPCRWGYAILDEGHKIRNPDAEVTLMAKQLQTVHR